MAREEGKTLIHTHATHTLQARRLERNAREQRRSVKIVSQIEELSNMLEEAGASSAKSCKASVLGAVSDYIETLQKRNATLEAEKCEIA